MTLAEVKAGFQIDICQNVKAKLEKNIKQTEQQHQKKSHNIKRHILHGLLDIGYREPETPC